MAEAEQSGAPAVITLNGKRVHTQRAILTYRDILALAGYGPNAASARPAVTVSYPRTSLLLDRSVGQGESAEVRAGMVLNVGLTSRA